jgi:Ras-related protein Rab-2A
MIFLETSAKTALNVEEAFVKTASSIYNKIQSKQIDPTNDYMGIKLGTEINDQELIQLRQFQDKNNKGNCQC